MLGLRENLLGLAGDLDEISRDIAGMGVVDERRTGLHRLLDVDLDGAGFVLDLDQRGRVFRGVAVARHHHHHGLADIVDVALGERPLRARVLHRRMRDEERHLAIEDADVLAGVDGDDAGMGAGRGSVDRRDLRPCIGAPDERCVERAGERDVVDEGALAAEQRRVDGPLDPRSEGARRHRLPYAGVMLSAALRTAAMMFW